MKKLGQIVLVGFSYEQDSIGQYGEKEKLSNPIAAEIQSVSRQEWTAAGQQGIEPQFTALIYSGNYSDQPKLDYNGKRYKIYRTYIRPDERIELDCQVEPEPEEDSNVVDG